MDPQPLKSVVPMTQPRGAEASAIAESPATDPAPAAQASPAIATAAQPAARNPFIPLVLVALTLAGSLALQSAQLLMDRDSLQSAHASQQQTVDKAGKLRASLDALAADTQRMADAGNANARVLVEELRKRGVTINAAATAPRP